MTIPPKGVSTGRKPKYMLSDLEIGGSRLFTDEKVRQAATNYGRRSEKRFVCRKEAKGVRVYRVELAVEGATNQTTG